MKMAGGALKALPISTSELIFGSQKEEKETPGDNGGIDEAENKNVIQPKEFFWDQFLKYLATAIALLTLLDFSLQFFRGGGGLLCYIPSDLLNNSDPTRDQAAFVNTFCLLSLSWSEYFPVFIILQGTLLIAPHYLWSALFGGQFDFFFDLVRQLDRLRDSHTGEYRPKNFDIVKKLEKEFLKTWKQFGIYPLYILKLILQLIVAFISLVLNPVLFPQSDFNFNFECPKDFDNASVPEGWSLPSSIQCVYPSFRVFSRIQIANYLLLILAVIISGCGLFWCFKRHTNALGYKEIALFAFTSCLRPDEYIFKPFINSPFSPRIGNDLDFLLTRLFRADSGHGQVFKDLQVHKELKRLVGIDHELLHAYHDAIKDVKKKRALNKKGRNTEAWDIQKEFFEAGFSKQDPEGEVFERLSKTYLGNVKLEPFASIRKHFFGFMQFGPKENRIAYDISFGTIGYSLILARAFQEVISVNFHPFYRNEKQVCRKDTFYTNYTTITFQDDIFTQKTENITTSDEAIDEVLRGDYPFGSVERTQFIVVGPFTDEAKKTTVNLHIERLNTGEYFGEGAALLTVRPLMIECKDVSERFCKYEPPEELFELNKDVLTKLRADIPTELKQVGDFQGINITCGHTECIFEFVVYKFIGEYPEHTPPHVIQQQLAELKQEHPSVVQSVRRQPPPNAIPVPPLPGLVPPPVGMMPPPLGTMPPHSGEPPNVGTIALILPANMFPQLDVSDIEQFFAGNATIQLSARNQESPIRLVLKGGCSEDSCREAKSTASSMPSRSFLRHVSEPARGHGPIAQNLSTFKNNRKQERLNEGRRDNERQKFSNTEATQQAVLEATAEVVDGQPTVTYQTSSGATSIHNGICPPTPSQPSPTTGENACNKQDPYSFV